MQQGRVVVAGVYLVTIGYGTLRYRAVKIAWTWEALPVLRLASLEVRRLSLRIREIGSEKRWDFEGVKIVA